MVSQCCHMRTCDAVGWADRDVKIDDALAVNGAKHVERKQAGLAVFECK